MVQVVGYYSRKARANVEKREAPLGHDFWMDLDVDSGREVSVQVMTADELERRRRRKEPWPDILVTRLYHFGALRHLLRQALRHLRHSVRDKNLLRG